MVWIPQSHSAFNFRLLTRHSDIFERVATEASKLAAYNKKSTISSREIQTSYVPCSHFSDILLTMLPVSDSFSPVNSQSTLFRKVPRLSQSTLHPRNRLFFLWVFIRCRICFGFGSSNLMMRLEWLRDLRVSFNALWMVCFYWGQMSSRSAFGVRGCTISLENREFKKTTIQ